MIACGGEKHVDLERWECHERQGRDKQERRGQKHHWEEMESAALDLRGIALTSLFFPPHLLIHHINSILRF